MMSIARVIILFCIFLSLHLVSSSLAEETSDGGGTQDINWLPNYNWDNPGGWLSTKNIPTTFEEYVDILKNGAFLAKHYVKWSYFPPKDPSSPENLWPHVPFEDFAPECLSKKEDYYYRKYDGSCNWMEKDFANWGAAGTAFDRDYPGDPTYSDGINAPREGPNARELSNAFFKRNSNARFEHTAWLVAFVEYLVHDTLYSVSTTNKSGVWGIPVPRCDPGFDPNCEGNHSIGFWRTAKVPGTATSKENPREPMNDASTWMDHSPLYGSSEEWAHKLRSFKDGKLLSQTGPDGGEYPPFNTMGLPMQAYGLNNTGVFAGGDPRTSQDWLILSLHVLFFRNHQRYCDMLKEQHPDWDDEKLYQGARMLNQAKHNMIGNPYQMSYFNNEMPDLAPPADDGMPLFRLGNKRTVWTISPLHEYPFKYVMKAVGPNKGRPLISSNALSIGYRFHEILPDYVSVMDKDNKILSNHSIISTAFDSKGFMEHGIDGVIRGMLHSNIYDFHSGVSEEYRTMKFNYRDPNVGDGFDLAAWSIEHERERGMFPFNEYFRKYSKHQPANHIPCPPRKTFEEFTKDPEMVKELKRLYKTPDDVDMAVGAQLDETWPPGIMIPTSQMLSAIYSIFGVANADRFSLGAAVMHCVMSQWPTDCTPSTILEEIIWEPAPTKDNPRARKQSEFWMKELNMIDKGRWSLFTLITDNSNVKCLQMNPMFPPDPVKNPVVCEVPQPPPPPNNTLFTIAVSVLATLAIVLCCTGCARCCPDVCGMWWIAAIAIIVLALVAHYTMVLLVYLYNH